MLAGLDVACYCLGGGVISAAKNDLGRFHVSEVAGFVRFGRRMVPKPMDTRSVGRLSTNGRADDFGQSRERNGVVHSTCLSYDSKAAGYSVQHEGLIEISPRSHFVHLLFWELTMDRCLQQESRASKRSPSISFAILIAAVLIGGFGPERANAQQAGAGLLAAPSEKDRTVARLIANLMPRNHISAQQLNDTISQRALDLFLKQLDPLKLYFYQSDIDEFKLYETVIDDNIKQGDLSLGYKVFHRFVSRIDEHVAMVDELLEGEFDFSKKESVISDPDYANYAANPEESRDRWRRRVKYDLLVLKDDETEGEEAIGQLRRRYERYARRWKKTDNDDLLEIFLTAVTMGYDPHSTYMSPGTLDDFKIQMGLNLDGIGAQLREKDGNTVVTRVIPGGAADKHGKLAIDDVIVNVGQGVSGGEMVDIVEMPLTDVVDLIRGKAGTTVRLGVKKGGSGAAEILQIVRARIELEESAARGEIIEQPGANGTPGLKVGYINLPSFYLDMDAAKRDPRTARSSTRDVQRILLDFQSKGIDGIVLDLSRNGGGSLTEAISLTGLFIDRGTVVQVKNSDGSVQQYADEDSGTAWDGPLVVMTSKFSASASEIFAGAIQDYRRGIVVGDPATHGKGTVQTLMNIGQQLFRNNRANYGALKVTLQQFYLPDGQSTQLKGVAADIVLPSLFAKMDVGEGDLDFALAHDTVRASRHSRYRMVPAPLVGMLQANSAERIKNNKEFNDLLERIETYVNEKEQTSLSVNEYDFMARRERLEAQREDEEKEIEDQAGSEEVYRDYYYNREVMNIAQEYIMGLRQQNLARAS